MWALATEETGNMANEDRFKFALTGNKEVPFLGYDSQSDPTNLSPQYLVGGSKNVILENTGNVSVRPGMKLVGDINATEDGVVASYEFEVVSGMTLPIWVLKSGVMQFKYLGIWYPLRSFDRTDFVFSTWWDNIEKLETLIMVNGDSNLYQWNAAITQFLSSAPESVGSVVSTANGGGSITGSYVVGDVLTLVGGDNNATIRVMAVGGSAIITYELLATGSNYTPGIYTTTAGSLSGATGATFSVTRVENTYTLTNEEGKTWAELGFNTAPNIGDLTGIGNTLVLNGVEYTYFGDISTDILMDVFPTIPGDTGPVGTPGDLIYQQIVVVEGTPQSNGHNDFIATLNNQLFVGSYTSKVVYISSDDSFSNFVNTGDIIMGDPDFAILGEFPTGMVVKGDSTYVFAGNSNDYVITPNTPAGDLSGVVYTKIEKQVGAGKSAAINQDFITTVGEDILYLSQDHQLRTLGTLRNITTQKSPSLSKAVRQELINEDFTGGQLRSVDEFVYITAPLSGKTYLYQIRDDVDDVGNLTAQRKWQPYQEWNISRIAVVDGVVQGYSSAYPQAYELWDTDQWHDDSPQGVNAPYECLARLAYQNNGLKTGMISFNMVYYEGYITPNSPLTGRVRFDYLGGTKNSGDVGYQDVIISSLTEAPTLFIGESVAELGVSLVGAEEIGGTTNLLQGFPKFRVIQDIEQIDVFEYQVELYSYAADSRWALKCFGVNPSQSGNNPVFLRKS